MEFTLNRERSFASLRMTDEGFRMTILLGVILSPSLSVMLSPSHVILNEVKNLRINSRSI
jgi:hypothetical protein